MHLNEYRKSSFTDSVTFLKITAPFFKKQEYVSGQLMDFLYTCVTLYQRIWSLKCNYLQKCAGFIHMHYVKKVPLFMAVMNIMDDNYYYYYYLVKAQRHYVCKLFDIYSTESKT